MDRKLIIAALLLATLLLTNLETTARSDVGLALSSVSYMATYPNDRIGMTMGMIGLYTTVAGVPAMIACGPIGVGVFL